MIKPTVGRVVWYWSSNAVRQIPDAQPNAALVTYVNADGRVNLAVFDSNGGHHPAQRVYLWQGIDERPTHAHCEWMPYQKEQAAKQQQQQLLVPPPVTK